MPAALPGGLSLVPVAVESPHEPHWSADRAEYIEGRGA